MFTIISNTNNAIATTASKLTIQVLSSRIQNPNYIKQPYEFTWSTSHAPITTKTTTLHLSNADLTNPKAIINHIITQMASTQSPCTYVPSNTSSLISALYPTSIISNPIPTIIHSETHDDYIYHRLPLMLPSIKQSKIKQLHHLDELAYFILYRKVSNNTYILDTTTKIINLDRAIEINTPIANGVIINNGVILPMTSNDSFDDYLFVHLNRVWVANEYLELVPATTSIQLSDVSELQAHHGLQVDWVHVICSVDLISDVVYLKCHDDGYDDEMIKANIKHVTIIEHANPVSDAVVSLKVYHLKHVNSSAATKSMPLTTIYNSYPIKPLAMNPILHGVLFNDANVITGHLDKYCVIKFNSQAVAFVNIPIPSSAETDNDLIMDGFVNTNSQLDNTIASTCNKLTVQVIGNNTAPLANTNLSYDIVIKIK